MPLHLCPIYTAAGNYILKGVTCALFLESKRQLKMNEAPLFVYSDGIIADQSYLEWLSEVKQRFKNSQIKAAIRVNTEMLSFYWSIGRDLVALKAEQRWGAGVVKQFALDMRNTFPEETGFSYTNVKYMKRWYLFYFQKLTKGHQLGDLLQPDRKSHQLGGFLEMPDIFGLVPWKHHVHIFSKCKTLDEALFYVNIVAKEGWSRSYLEDQVTAKLFSRQGAVANNFDKTLPVPHNDLAKELLKDPYNFGFLTMKERYDEQDLEDALVQNITRFLLELGQGFSFVGRQMELQMPNGQTFFPDLVFYHIPQHRYVIIELKAVKFIPEFAGKLNFYVTAADELLRGEGDNPSVGLVICKSSDKTIVEWSLKDIQKPLGVATYQLKEVVERTVKEIEVRNKKRIQKP